MYKFAFIGAGSFKFTRTIVKDLFTFSDFMDCEISLMDTDPERLKMIELCCEKLKKEMGVPAKITSTLSRQEALMGADGVLCTVFNGGIDIWQHDILIPKKYGVDINVGDTRSVSGIFRTLRNIPLMLDICKDIEEYCPNALFLNYTNPMSMLCKAMQTYTKVNVTGLCHSVQGSIKMLAEWIGKPLNEIDYTCMGVNHQAFYTKFEWNGTDAYPMLREKLKDPEYYNKEIVRNEMFKHLDYYVTESSGHNSEYNAWFRKRPDLIEKYCTHGTNWNPGLYAFSLNYRKDINNTWKQELNDWLGNDKIDTTRSNEYAAEILYAFLCGENEFRFNGNVLNKGYINNLPENCCVEVPVITTKNKLTPIKVGSLPKHLAILVNTTASLEDLTVEAAMEKNKRKVFHAVCMDPLTSAVCSLQEIKDMVDELFEVNNEFLGDYK